MEVGALRIAVVMGGLSEEREVSKKTGECVVSRLSASFRVKPVEILAGGGWRVARGFVGESVPPDPGAWFDGHAAPALEALAGLRREVDVVFNALHGPWGEDGTIQGLFRYAGIPFTGPDLIPAAITMDKCFTKDALRGAGIDTPRFLRIPRSFESGWEGFVEAARAEVPFPWVVKPRRLGSSVGVEIFEDGGAFGEWAEGRAVQAAGNRGADGTAEPCGRLRLEDYLIEEFVSGRELTCGVVEDDGVSRALPPIEIRPRTSSFFDYRAKYTSGATEELCPAPLTEDETTAVERLAVRIHDLFECAPLSRTDMLLAPGGRLTVLEINTLPGMTATSLIPLAAGRAGISLERLFARLVGHALARTRDRIGARALETA